MRHRLLLIILFVPYFSNCQNPFQEFNTVKVDSKNKFEIKDENRILKLITGKKDTVRSALVVNNDVLRRIWFTTSSFANDTLIIEINRTDQVYDHHYLIKIFKGKCIVNYQYQMDGPELERRVTPIEYMVKLSSLDFRKGKVIRGYTEFKGKCEGEGCYGEESLIINGNFKVLIK